MVGYLGLCHVCASDKYGKAFVLPPLHYWKQSLARIPGNHDHLARGRSCGGHSLPGPARPFVPAAWPVLGCGGGFCGCIGCMARADRWIGKSCRYQLSTHIALTAGRGVVADQGAACRHGEHPHRERCSAAEPALGAAGS